MSRRANRPPRFIEVVADYRNGVPVADIAKQYQCSRGTVQRYARMAGLPIRSKGFAEKRRTLVIEMYKSGRLVKEIAAAASVSHAYVSKVAVEEEINRRIFKMRAQRNE
jgi:DNA invertase Pin-like site-specific DNA recombinase